MLGFTLGYSVSLETLKKPSDCAGAYENVSFSFIEIQYIDCYSENCLQVRWETVVPVIYCRPCLLVSKECMYDVEMVTYVSNLL